MISPIWSRTILIFQILLLICSTTYANESLYQEARTLQREGKYDEAITVYKNYLSIPFDSNSLSGQESAIYTEALVQLMNTFQSKESHAPQPDRTAPLHYDFSTAKLNFLYHPQPLNSR